MNEACVGLISLNNIGWSFIHVVANNRTLAFLLIDNIPISLYNIFIIHVSGDDHHGELLLDNHRCAFVCWYNCFDKYRLACICCYRSFISLADIYALWTLLRYRGMDCTMNICLSAGFTYEVTVETTAELSISCPIEIL